MEFLQNISINQFADIGFGLLVAGICLKTLFTDKNALKKQREVWKEELFQLELSLKELISEASDASEIFDKKIQRRQKELNSLLEKTELSIKEIGLKATTMATYDQDRAQPLIEQLEVTEKIDPPWAKNSLDAVEIPKKMEDSLKRSEKGASVRYKTLSALGKISNAEGGVASSSLKSEIELEKAEEEKVDNFIFQQTSIVDPVAFKIAKRLLLEGKELHIVARKLELPVSEIRHLDSLLRAQVEKANLPLPKALAEKQIRRVRGIVRDPLEKRDESSTLSNETVKSIEDTRPLNEVNESADLF